MIDAQDVIKGYCEAALWADAILTHSDPDHPEYTGSWESGGMNGTHDIDAPGEPAIGALIESWVTENAELLARYERAMSGRFANSEWTIAEQAGHDLRLTAGGHGTGFWDRGLADSLADALTDAAKAFGDICCFEVDIDRCTFNV